jgi:hypothetical protein
VISAGSHKGFIAFCETNLRYEKGFKAWVVLGPYLFGAFVLEVFVNSFGNTPSTKIALWAGFLLYLIVFPEIWRRVLKSRASYKSSVGPIGAPAEKSCVCGRR